SAGRWHQENFGEAHFRAADWVVAHTEILLRSDHPGRFASTPPHKEGTITNAFQEFPRFPHFINFSNSAIVVGFRTGGCTARNTPSAYVIGVRPCESFTSSFAPWSASSCTILSNPRFAAPCIAVNPCLLTAFTSAPLSRQSFAASRYSSSDRL